MIVSARKGEDGEGKKAIVLHTLRDAAEMCSHDGIRSWSSADDGSGSALMELTNDGEISITSVARGVQYDFSIVAERGSDRSRSIGTIIETRTDHRAFLGLDGPQALTLVRGILSAWIADCAILAEHVEPISGIEEMQAFAERTAVITAMEQSAVDDVVACAACAKPDLEFPWSPAVQVVHPTRLSAYSLSVEMEPGTIGKFDDGTIAALSARTPHVTRAHVEGGGYSSAVITFEPWTSTRWMEDWPDALGSMRRFASLGIGHRPLLEVMREIA